MSEEDDNFRAREAKIRAVALSYYSRKDIEKAIYEFCIKRETVPRYMEGFGKRPNSLEYPSEILSLVRNGATSFHSSEERWSSVMDLSVGKDSDDMNEMREGWDLLIDIDSKYFDYSKKAAISIIKALEFNKIKNIGVKFSGNKGWHIIVPWEAFPKEINGIETRKMFPVWPRKIMEYLMEVSKPILEEEIMRDGGEELKKVARGIRCEQCKNIASESYMITLTCPSRTCRTSEQIRKNVKEVESSEKDSSFINGKKRKCLQCSSPMQETSKVKFAICENSGCDNYKKDSIKNPDGFSSVPMHDIYETLGLDVILVSPRHLFRTPYSLHEKTALSSVVIDKSEIHKFTHKDADPVRVVVKNFLPVSTPNEAKELLVQALDWTAKSKIDKSIKEKSETKSSFDGDSPQKKFNDVVIDRSKLTHPPSIESILKGLADGRKRGLFIILNYFKSLNFTEEETLKIAEEWNSKNKKQLRDAYIVAQVQWTFKQKKLLPPNYDKPHYKGIGISPTDEELKSKNPVSYAIRKMFSKGGKGYK